PARSGVNPEALSVFHNVFEIGNQGTQDVCVDFEVDVPSIPDDADVPARYDFGPGDPAVVFYRGNNRDEYTNTSLFDTDRDAAISLPLDNGESQCIGFEVRAFGFESGTDLFEDIELTIRADTDAQCRENVADPVPRILGPTDGLVGYWPLDSVDDGTAEDVVGDNDGTVVGDASSVTGAVGNAASLDGGNDYVEVSDTLDLVEAFSLSALVKAPTEQGSWTRLISREQSGEGNRQYNLIFDNDGTKARTAVDTLDEDAVIVEDTDSIIDDEWHLLTTTFDASSELRLYVDGTEVDSESVSSPVVSRSSELFFGTIAHTPGKRLYEGQLDDVRIYDRALSSSEVSSLHDATIGD
ncbi:MAG: LamG domain-containing protein, partial [Haloferacaceae archaeon]